MTRGERVQYGCGFSAAAGWRNFDASPTLRFERLPLLGRLYSKNAQRFPENVSYGDIVEGLPLPDDSCELVYCSHVLEHLALEDMRGACAAISFVRDSGLGRERRSRSVKAFLREWLGSGSHLWMWDYRSMARELREAGFTEIRRADFGDSEERAFAEVEDDERWRGCLGVECRK